MSYDQVMREVHGDESAFVWFYIAVHYNALRLEWAQQYDEYGTYVQGRLLRLMRDLHFEYRIVSSEVNYLAWEYAKQLRKCVQVDLSCTEVPKKGRGKNSFKADGKVVHLVTGMKFQVALDQYVRHIIPIRQKKQAPFEWSSTFRDKNIRPKKVICRVWYDEHEPAIVCVVDLVRDDLFDHRVDLSDQVHHHNGQYFQLRNQMSLRVQLKIDRTLQMAPQFWATKIPDLLLKRSTEVCCQPHRKSVGHSSSCVRSIESHWKKVLGPIFLYSAGQWTEVPKLIKPVMASLSRLSFLLPQGEFQGELSAILLLYIDATSTGVELSDVQRNDYCLDEPQMVELVTLNLLAYDKYLDVLPKISILEWICDRMKLANVSSVYFTSSLLQYLNCLANGIDRSKRTNPKVDLLCKVAKLAQWIGKMLDEGQKDLKPLVEDEQEEDDSSDEGEEHKGEATQDYSDPANEPNQSQPAFSHTAHLRTLARKLNRKCDRLVDKLNDDKH